MINGGLVSASHAQAFVVGVDLCRRGVVGALPCHDKVFGEVLHSGRSIWSADEQCQHDNGKDQSITRVSPSHWAVRCYHPNPTKLIFVNRKQVLDWEKVESSMLICLDLLHLRAFRKQYANWKWNFGWISLLIELLMMRSNFLFLFFGGDNDTGRNDAA